jgi:polysaccharide biosynthesis PFTS motif protein
MESGLISDRVELHKIKLLKVKSNNQNIFFDKFFIVRYVVLIFNSILEIFRYSKVEASREKNSLVYDLTRQHLPPNINSQELHEFFFQPDRRIINKNSKTVTIIQKSTSAKKFNYKSMYFKKNLANYIISNEKNSFRKVKLVFLASVHSIHFSVSSIKTKNLKYIINEIFEIALFLFSEARESLNELILTNNSFFNYPAISYIPKSQRNFSVVMLHYSENAFDWTKIPSQQELSWVSFAKADFHKVWTPEYAKYLINLNIYGKVESCGSIIFRPKIRAKSNLKDVIRIAVFDVTPSIIDDEFGPYSRDSGIAFLECIYSFYQAAKENYSHNIELVFKPKRRDIPEHFSSYLNLREKLFNLKGVRGAKWSENIYEIIASSNFVICMVGTSPAIVAKELKIPVVYLHVGTATIFQPPVENGIKVISSLEELMRNFQRFLQ